MLASRLAAWLDARGDKALDDDGDEESVSETEAAEEGTFESKTLESAVGSLEPSCTNARPPSQGASIRRSRRRGAVRSYKGLDNSESDISGEESDTDDETESEIPKAGTPGSGGKRRSLSNDGATTTPTAQRSPLQADVKSSPTSPAVVPPSRQPAPREGKADNTATHVGPRKPPHTQETPALATDSSETEDETVDEDECGHSPQAPAEAQPGVVDAESAESAPRSTTQSEVATGNEQEEPTARASAGRGGLKRKASTRKAPPASTSPPSTSKGRKSTRKGTAINNDVEDEKLEPASKRPALAEAAPIRRTSKGRRGVVLDNNEKEEPLETARKRPAEAAVTRRTARGRRGTKAVAPDEEMADTAASPVPTQATQATPSPARTGGGQSRKRRTAAAQDPEEDTTEPAAKSSSRTKRRASTQDRQDVRVLFTGIVSKALEKDIQTLGGQIVSDVAHCDVLLTDKVRRTTKFLEALAAGKPIVDDQWLEASRASHSLAPADDHLLVDKEREATYGFSLREAVQAARKAPAFADKMFFVTKTLTSPPPGELKAMIGFAGGRIVSNARSADFIIGTDKDKKKGKEAIYSAELILTGILRQKLEPDQFQL